MLLLGIGLGVAWLLVKNTSLVFRRGRRRQVRQNVAPEAESLEDAADFINLYFETRAELEGSVPRG